MNSWLLLTGLALSTAIGGAAYWRRMLTRDGWLGAVIVGTLTLGFGGWAWGVTVVAFFVSSSLLSRYKARVKAERTGEKFAKGGQRDFGQVMANGGLASLLALLYGLLGQPPLLLAAFAGVMGTVTADTWATELGTLSRQQPRLITSGQPVATGTSGGVSPAGMLATAGGALFVSLVLALILWLAGTGALAGMAVVGGTLGGVVGSLSDSLLGATVQVLYRTPAGDETERPTSADGQPHAYARGWRWMNNDVVNLASSLAGMLVAVGVGVLAG